MKTHRLILTLTLAACLSLGAVDAFAAYGDEAPPPRKMPRTPVKREQVASDKHPVLPPSRTLGGTPTVVDTERLKLEGYDIRLFGIVPPQMSASFGPQARAAMDTLSAGGIACSIRDRDRDGRLLATCQNSAGTDIALDLLRRGLAATARGSLQGSDVAATYIATEQAAQAQHLGLWSVALPAAASDASVREASQRQQQESDAAAKAKAAEAEAAAKEKAAKEQAEKDKAAEEARAKAEKAAEDKATAEKIAAEKVAAEKAAAEAAKPATTMPPLYLAPLPPPLADSATEHAAASTPAPERIPGFMERYQLLVTGLLMLATALGIGLALILARWIDRREELRSIAAALRGEMMAARALCLSRMRAIETEQDDRHAGWPRIRVLVFQAYVGRLGRLGAELARQIASIYGQASDYASYFGTAQNLDSKFEPMSKRQALTNLAGHIDEVLPRLAAIETSRLFGGKPRDVLPPPKAAAPPSMPTFPPGGGTRLLTRDDKTEAPAEDTPSEPHKATVTPGDFAATRTETTGESRLEAVAVVEETSVALHTEGESKTSKLWGVLRRLTGERRAIAAMDEELPPEYAALSDEEIAAIQHYTPGDEPVEDSSANSVLFATTRQRG